MPIDPPRTPPEIARETLRRLALQRVAPTPDNYRAYYHEIAGIAAEDAFPERSLKLIANALPRETPEAVRRAHGFENAVSSRQWSALKQAVLALCARNDVSVTNWALLIREILNQLERPHRGWTNARKKESLEHVLSGSGSTQHLPARLQGLLKSWVDSGSASGAPTDPATTLDDATGAGTIDISTTKLTELLDRLQHLLKHGVAPLILDNDALTAELIELSARLSEPLMLADDDGLGERMYLLTSKLELAGESERAIRSALVGLIRLIVDNISDLVADDSWLSGQINLLSVAFQGNLDIRMLDEVERRLRDVIDKQGHLKRQLDEAQIRLKRMLSGFVDQLAELSDSTDHYHTSLERCATEIASASSLEELANVIEGVLEDTRSVRETTKRSSSQLNALREEVDSANRQIARLQQELDETSELVRHDALTGTLNRKGLDEALEREIGRARRKGAPMCLAMLDIDNFKHLNDTFGHKTGDDALRHLAEVIRTFTRPQDMVGRYGGEEFLILLPDTEIDAAVQATVRLQRELTKRFFLAENQRVLITFSAGVARIDPDEDPYSAIDRADKAMYAAKRAGKNRVLIAG